MLLPGIPFLWCLPLQVHNYPVCKVLHFCIYNEPRVNIINHRNMTPDPTGTNNKLSYEEIYISLWFLIANLQAHSYHLFYVWNIIDTNHNNYTCINFQILTLINIPQTQARKKTRTLYCSNAYTSLRSVTFMTSIKTIIIQVSICVRFTFFTTKSIVPWSTEASISVTSVYTFPSMQTWFTRAFVYV